MSNFRPFSELNNSPGSDPLTSAANAARRMVCSAYNAFPGLFLPPALPGLRAVREAGRRFFDNTLCPGPVPPGENPSPVYAPGCNVTYRASITRTDIDGSNPVTFTRDGSNIIRVDGFPVGNNAIRLVMINTNGINVGRDYVASVGSNFPGYRVSNVSLQRLDGLPLNTACTTPPTINPDLIFPTEININVGGDIVPISISPVTYNVDGNTYFSPQFNTSLGPIEFSLGGVSFSPVFLPTIIVPPGGGGGGVTPQEVQQIVNNENNTQTTNISNILQDRSDELAEFIRCLIERPNEQINTTTLASNNPGATFSLPTNCFAVVIQRTEPIRTGTRIQSGSGANPNVEYWGWLAVGRNGNNGIRQNLSYQDTIVFIPERANEILVNPTFGNRFDAFALSTVNTCVFGA